MNERTVEVPLAPEEWEMVCRLRDVPPGRSRRELLALLRDLVTFAAAPGCSEMQADGVPCASVHASCDDCQRIASCLSRMRYLVGAPEVSGLA
jgi:hypothetical protein